MTRIHASTRATCFIAVRNRLTLVVLIVALLAISRLTAADSTAPDNTATDDPTGALNELFDAGAKNTPTAAAAAKTKYDKLHKAHPDDARIDYAFAVTLVNQRRTADALPLLTRAIQDKTAERDLNQCALAAKVWAELHARRTDDALSTAASLAQSLAKSSTGKPNESDLSAARLIGTTFGYFEFANPDAVDAAAGKTARDKIAAALPSPLRTVFDGAAAQVKARVAQLKTDDQARLNKLKKDSQKTAAESRDKATERSDTVDDLKTDRDATQKKLDDAQDDLQKAQKDHQQLISKLTNLKRQLAQQKGKPGKNNNPGKAARLKGQLNPLEKEANQSARQLDKLKDRAAELKRDVQQSTAAIEKQQKLAKGDQRRADDADERARDGGGTLADRLASFATFQPFPYQQERERVLNWYAR